MSWFKRKPTDIDVPGSVSIRYVPRPPESPLMVAARTALHDAMDTAQVVDARFYHDDGSVSEAREVTMCEPWEGDNSLTWYAHFDQGDHTTWRGRAHCRFLDSAGVELAVIDERIRPILNLTRDDIHTTTISIALTVTISL